ncbi:MAG TPA: hypothetical protein VFK48_01345 [Usitatibacter sp.]|nr:hypothetical protein [Usitatibacter sp.]
MKPRPRQAGIALVLVLWVSVLLTVIASSFIMERRTESMIVANSAAIARAEAAANAGVMRAVHELYRGESAPEPWRRDGARHEFSFDGIPVTVEIVDESAKIDINTAADPLLLGLLRASGLKEDEAAQLLDAIVDWRDPDSLKRPNGAEEGDYRAAGLAYKPANTAFQAIEELQLVLGMRPDIYRRLAPLVTVFSRQPGVNARVASREVLLAIPGTTAELVDQYIAQREAAREQKLPLPAFPQAGGFGIAESLISTVRSRARTEDGVVYMREAAALLRPTPRKPVTFIAWRESTAAPPEEAPKANP